MDIEIDTPSFETKGRSADLSEEFSDHGLRSLPSFSPSPPTSASAPKYGYAYGGTSHREKPLREYVATILNYKYLIALSVVIGIYVGNYLHSRQPIYYQTSAVVNVGSYLAPTDGPTADVIKYETSRIEYLENLTPMISSYALARDALRRDPVVWMYFDVDLRERFAKLPAEELDNVALPTEVPIYVLDAYLGSVTSFRDKSTTLFSITATGATSEIVSRIANVHASAFMDAVRKQRFTWANTNAEFLQKRVSDLRTRSEAAEKEMATFAREKKINPLSSTRQSEFNNTRVETMVSDIGQTALERVLLDQQYRALRGTVSSDGISISDKSFQFLPQLRQLESQVSRLKSQGYSGASTEIYESQIRNMKQLLKQSTAQEIREARAKRSAIEAKEKFLKGELDELKKQQLTHAEDEVQFLTLERQSKLLKEELTKLESRLDEALINTESDQRSVSVVEQAIAPQFPVSTRRSASLLSGALLGLIIGVGLAFLLEHQRGAIRTSADLKAIIDAPVLGVIPRFSARLLRRLRPAPETTREKEKGLLPINDADALSATFVSLVEETVLSRTHGNEASRLILNAQPHGRESESLRSIRAALKFNNRVVNPRKILVTSGQKHDGKSTVTVNLAASIAQTLSRTLIIDADLRMPTVHTFFNHERYQRGLGDFLMQPGRISDYVLNTELEYLDVMVAGTSVTNPAELLGTRSMLELLEQAAEEYDYIFVDTPPIGEIADALLLCPGCDGVVVVARSDSTPVSVLELANTRLSQVRAKVLGTVLNDVNKLDGITEGYYGYSYSYTRSPR